jgi:hypothetical protein
MAMMRWDDMTWDQKYAWYDANQPKPWNSKSNRAIRFRSCSKIPDSKLTKGYVKRAKKSKRSYGGLSLREMQKASHKLQRLEDKREIELGLQDHEEQQKYTYSIDFAEEGEDFTGIYFYELDDCEDEQPSKFRGMKPTLVILDDLMSEVEAPPRWYYTHEGD